MPEVEVKLLDLMVKNNIRKASVLAKKAELSDQVVNNILNEKASGMRLDTIVKLCSALDCEIGELIVIKKEVR